MKKILTTFILLLTAFIEPAFSQEVPTAAGFGTQSAWDNPM